MLKPLVNEALAISRELGDVIFIGAIARYLYTKDLRESHDLDFAMEKPVSDEELLILNYKNEFRNGKEIWYTPRGIKIDRYTKDVSKIPLHQIIKNSKYIPVGNKGEKLRAIGLESLIVAKHRAGREQDSEDLSAIAHAKYNEIKWEILKEIAGDEHEYNQIKSDMSYLAKSR